MNTAKSLCGLLTMSLILASSPAWAQRTQLATPVDSTPGAAAAGAPATPLPSSAAPSGASVYPTPSLPPTTTPPPSVVAPPSAAPALPAGATPAAPALPSGGASIYTPPPGVGFGRAAPATGVTQPPPPGWDPYAPPSNTPSALLPNDPYFQSSPNISMAAMQKFVQHVNLEYDWFAGNPSATNKELGINDVDLNVTFAFPMFRNIQTPLLVTPGFAVHYWSGPTSVLPPPPAPANPPPVDLPPQTFDAYLDFAWNPQISDNFGAELNFRTGIFSDFARVTSDSIRFMGKGMAVIKLWPHITLKAGVWYLDRVQVKILPAGGFVWTPSEEFYCDILFPNPKIAKRLTISGNTQWWIYGRGDYGGGTWTIKRNTGYSDAVPAWQHPADGTYTRFDYNDIRIAAGLEFKTLRQMEGHVEVGLSCSRELVYMDNLPRSYFPTNTVYVGAGLSY